MVDNILTADGRSVGFTPHLRAVIHPDDRGVCAKILRTTYRSLRAAGWERAVSRHAASAMREHYSGNRPLFLEGAGCRLIGVGLIG